MPNHRARWFTTVWATMERQSHGGSRVEPMIEDSAFQRKKNERSKLFLKENVKNKIFLKKFNLNTIIETASFLVWRSNDETTSFYDARHDPLRIRSGSVHFRERANCFRNPSWFRQLANWSFFSILFVRHHSKLCHNIFRFF